MTTIALQQELITKITTIQDDSILAKIKNLIAKEEKPKKLLAMQQELIAQAEEEFRNGEFSEHTVFMNKLAKKYGW